MEKFAVVLFMPGGGVSNLKRIILGVLAILAVVAVAVGATVAQFSDSETAEENTFTAGTIDLLVNGAEDGATVESISLSDLKPGDGVSYQYTFSNTGSLPGQPWIEIINLADDDNGCNEPESTAPASDATCGDGGGELSDNLMLKINAPGATGYVYPHCPGGGDSGSQCPLRYWAENNPWGLSGEVWEAVPAGGNTAPMVLEFELPESVGNIVESDSAEFDIVFHLDQI